MRIAVWKTGHPIADTVAQSLAMGFRGQIKHAADYCGVLEDEAQIAYGILRGTADVFQRSKHWFNVDRGYFWPGHYEGYYRISYKGTQAKFDPAFPIAKPYEGDIAPPIRRQGIVLLCPPTEHVCDFFGIDLPEWINNAVNKSGINYVIRNKNTNEPIDWDAVKLVITFNSSVGWQALSRGIPCLSDPQHSVVGSFYNTISIDELLEIHQRKYCKPLFDFMRSHQFTLDEIAKGDACPLVRHYMFSSDMTGEKPSAPMLQHTASAIEPQPTLSSIFSNTAT